MKKYILTNRFYRRNTCEKNNNRKRNRNRLKVERRKDKYMRNKYILSIGILLFMDLFLNTKTYSQTFDFMEEETYYDRFRYNYQFSTGVNEIETFGIPTSTDEIVSPNLQGQNIRRNKDVSFAPVPYGVFSGDIPTAQTNPYIQPDLPTNIQKGISTLEERLNTIDDGMLRESTSLLNDEENFMEFYTVSAPSNNYMSITQEENLYQSTYQPQITSGNRVNIEPIFYNDGSIGILSIPSLNKEIRVWEGETETNMKLGVGHFSQTSAWDGNVGFAGHNRGSYGYFENVKNLKIGDRLKYETSYGIRNYKIILKERIQDDDYSYLNWSDENMVTLITCVENSPSERWVIQAMEV